MPTITELMDSGRSGIAFQPQDMVRELIAYGETEAAEKLLSLDNSLLLDISEIAGKLSSGNVTIDGAICLAIVQVIEGTARPLKRKRRIYPKI